MKWFTKKKKDMENGTWKMENGKMKIDCKLSKSNESITHIRKRKRKEESFLLSLTKEWLDLQLKCSDNWEKERGKRVYWDARIPKGGRGWRKKGNLEIEESSKERWECKEKDTQSQTRFSSSSKSLEIPSLSIGIPNINQLFWLSMVELDHAVKQGNYPPWKKKQKRISMSAATLKAKESKEREMKKKSRKDEKESKEKKKKKNAHQHLKNFQWPFVVGASSTKCKRWIRPLLR